MAVRLKKYYTSRNNLKSKMLKFIDKIGWLDGNTKPSKHCTVDEQSFGWTSHNYELIPRF